MCNSGPSLTAIAIPSSVIATKLIFTLALCISGWAPARTHAYGLRGPGSDQETLLLAARAVNPFATFRQFLYSFPLKASVVLTALSGSVSILSKGQGFAEALFSVDDLPSGGLCPASGESFASYSETRSRHPGLRTLARFIVKQPLGSPVSSMPTNVRLPKPVRVSHCLIVVLDGAVLRVGGQFMMSSNIVAHLRPGGGEGPSVSSLSLDDEFCFDRVSGCQLATRGASPEIAFMKVVPIKQSGVLLALYGDISDSAFGWGGSEAPKGPWTIDNAYYVYPKCSATEGLHGPEDYFAHIPANARKLFSLKMSGKGQSALQQPLYQALSTALTPGDCLVHLVRLSAAQTLGGVDAESQIMALVESTSKQ
jgi:hypothetical protein